MSNGQVILLSTGWGKRGFFHDIWTANNEYGWHWPWNDNFPDDDWERYSVPAPECPRITKEFLEKEEQKMPDWFFKQEYLCDFAETQNSMFRHDDITAMFTDEIKPVDAGKGDLVFDDGLKAKVF